MNTKCEYCEMPITLAFFLILTLVALFSFYPTKKVPPKPIIRQPINWTNTGKSVGIRIGRTGRGFVKGLWNSGDDK